MLTVNLIETYRVTSNRNDIYRKRIIASVDFSENSNRVSLFARSSAIILERKKSRIPFNLTKILFNDWCARYESRWCKIKNSELLGFGNGRYVTCFDREVRYVSFFTYN